MEHLYELLKLEAREIDHYFQKASIEGNGTPQEVSDRREVAIKKFLEKYFPFPYRIAKGNIRDSYGNNSDSIDCIILNPVHPYTVSDDEKYSIILADGVDASIEVKPDLSNESEIQRGLKQIASVKRLTRKNHGLLSISKFTKEEIDSAKKIPTFIFGNKTYSNIRTLIEKIVDFYVSKSIPQEEQFDFIVINNRCMIFNFKKCSHYLTTKMEGIYFTETRDMTIAGFLFWLNKLPQSAPRMSSPVLSHYINLENEQIQTFSDLNWRLLKK